MKNGIFDILFEREMIKNKIKLFEHFIKLFENSMDNKNKF